MIVVPRLVIPVPSTSEESILLRCLTPGEAAELIRPVLNEDGATIVVRSAQAPRVITIRATPAGMQKRRRRWTCSRAPKRLPVRYRRQSLRSRRHSGVVRIAQRLAKVGGDYKIRSAGGDSIFIITGLQRAQVRHRVGRRLVSVFESPDSLRLVSNEGVLGDSIWDR